MENNGIPPAAVLYMVFVCLVAALTLCALSADIALWSVGARTMSGWLRVHPLWFVVPAVMVVLLLGALTMHLMVR